MNLQQLEYIVALDKTKNFTKAAESCFITQATLSTMVRRLEEELDVVLFDRKVNPIVTTDCGRELVDEAKKALHHIEQIRQLALTAKDRIEGKISIGIIPTIAGNLLPIILLPLLEKYPKLEISIVEITPKNILNQLKNGTIDAGILSSPHQWGNEFEENILYYEKLMVYGKDTKGKKFVLPDEINEDKIWLFKEGYSLRDEVVNLCALESKPADGALKFEAGSFDTLLNMVDTFGGFTLIPELYYNSMPEERKEFVADFKSPYPVREVNLIHYKPFAKSRLIEMLIREIKERMKGLLSTENMKNSEQLIYRN